MMNCFSKKYKDIDHVCFELNIPPTFDRYKQITNAHAPKFTIYPMYNIHVYSRMYIIYKYNIIKNGYDGCAAIL